MILLLVTGAALPARTCGNHSSKLIVPGWVCLVDRPQPFLYFSITISALQPLTARVAESEVRLTPTFPKFPTP